ncbi:chloramphenicol O-acetyltransferase [Anaeromyces robustus]|uniref:Chloramphenicol O-acetyltransferase n=1 Tax=Anaeromyces robustus TaxID=1754192 RepID=A0A1Y1WGA9_9FUNG|nr:chloramphenicol O-acetyltransferase [Anaeromyces robustus]|eukprot:ORX72527.1 chloramphenicol O-acetyltransferase [Anaeromyces robustus]
MTSEYKEKVLDKKVEELPFTNFLTSRYSMTVRLPAQNTFDYAKREGMSFFNLTLACLLKALNEIPEFRYRIKNEKVIEYEKINAVTPIMMPDHTIREIEIKPVSEFNSLREWNDYVDNKKKNINDNLFSVEPSLRDILPIGNFSCIPWINFDSMTNVMADSKQLMPVITWGKFVDGKIPISLTASHIFIFGWQFKLFYEKAEDYLTHPEKLI